MNPERWKRTEEIFQAALERAPDERASFLDEACAGDETLKQQIESLILNQQEAGAFFEAAIKGAEGLLPPGNDPPEMPAHIGPYKVLRQIGRGGMGTVYLAARDDDAYKKRVAIKLIRRGMDTEDILRRFRNER